MIIAVDFDNTLSLNGKPNTALFRQLNSAKRNGAILILWTCRAGASLAEAVTFCNQNGLTFHLVNANTPQTIRQLGYDPRKVLADLYIDDKSAPIIGTRANDDYK